MAMSTAADWAAKPRHLEAITLDHAEVNATDGWVSCKHGSWSFSLRIADCTSVPVAGNDYELETVGTLITGLRGADGWLMHKTDQQLADDHNMMVAGFQDERRRTLDSCREAWTEQEAALPDWLRERLSRFRTNGGERFDLDGWGYELVICRLAAVLADGDEDAANALASESGATGNQWDCAKALASHHQGGADLTQFPAGLTPLTGDPYYLGKTES